MRGTPGRSNSALKSRYSVLRDRSRDTAEALTYRSRRYIAELMVGSETRVYPRGSLVSLAVSFAPRDPCTSLGR
jgi:hypothetical protein